MAAFTKPKLRSKFRTQERARLFRQQKDHPGKLDHSCNELEYDSSEKWPEHAEQRNVIYLQEHGCHAEACEQVKDQSVVALALRISNI